MVLLILGLAFWIAAHFMKRLAPGLRGSIAARFGEGPSKGVVAALIGVGLVLVIIGYRSAGFTPLYTPPAWGIHLNNLAMFAAVALMGMGNSKGRARTWLRHPMLTGVLVWALAHLLVNGDAASVVMFGTFAVWAVAEMLVINARAGTWQPPAPGPVSGDVRLLVITAVIYGVIVVIHAWLGYWPFPS